MGWWWRSEASTDAAVATSHPSPIDDPKRSLATSVQSEESSKSRPAKILTRDEESERELMEWLAQMEPEAKESQASNQPAETVAETPVDIAADSLYPTEMSCRSAFDYALFCQSFGGQFVNVYRYGTFRSCTNHWQDFWLCMRTRQWDREDRQKAIGDHNRQKVIKYKKGPSSEDVWQMRTEPVQDAFQGDYEDLERRIAEFKRQNPDGAKS